MGIGNLGKSVDSSVPQCPVVTSIVSGLFGGIDMAGMGSDQLLFTIVRVSLHSKENGFLKTIQSASSSPLDLLFLLPFTKSKDISSWEETSLGHQGMLIFKCPHSHSFPQMGCHC